MKIQGIFSIILIFVVVACSKSKDERSIEKKSVKEPSHLQMKIVKDNQENIAILTQKEQDYFKKMFVIQTKQEISDFPKKINGHLEVKGDQIKLLSNEGDYMFKLSSVELDTVSKKQFEIIDSYGISAHIGKFALKKNMNKKKVNSIDQILINKELHNSKTLAEIKKIRKTYDDDCTSGGEGSSTCSIDEGDIGPVGGSGCSVECDPGYYSCCDSSTVRCTCKSDDEDEHLAG